MSKGHHPLDVACKLLDIAAENDRTIAVMQLVKLMFLAHGWHLALNGKPMINKKAQAWMYGPVYPDVYACFHRFGGDPITNWHEIARDYKHRKGLPT